MITEVTEKACSKCKLILNLSEFGYHSQTKLKVRSECRSCKTVKDQNYSTNDYIEHKKIYEANKAKIDRHKFNPGSGEKFCNCCDQFLGISNFNIITNSTTGYQNFCRICTNEKKRARYQSEDPERHKKYRKEQYWKDPEKYREASRKYQEANPEKVREANKTRYYKDHEQTMKLERQRYQKHRDKKIVWAKQWQDRNPGKVKIRNNKWKFANPEKVSAMGRQRKACKLNCCPPWAQDKGIYKDQIIELYRQCKELSKSTGIPHHVDHFIPLQPKRFIPFEGEMIALVCGLHVPCNLQILTATENMTKHNKFEVWIESEVV